MEEVYSKLLETYEELKKLKSENRTETDRRIQICVTEYEKIIAYFNTFVLDK